MQSQDRDDACNEACDKAAIEKNGVAPNGLQPRSHSIDFNESYVASVITTLTTG